VANRQLEKFARYTPVLILAYFTIQFVIRVGFSSNLETDEAEFVGRTYLALGYGNSHPPLYNWLVRGALEITGWRWPAAVALVKAMLLSGTYLLSFDMVRRITGRALPGLILVASFMLLPQVVWKAQITLAHSVLLMFAVVGMLHATVLVVLGGGVVSFLWLGIAASVGALAKYNFLIMFGAVLVAAYTIPFFRERLFRLRLGLSLALFALLVTPHLIWATQNVGVSTRRIAKLGRTDTTFGMLDVALVGVDGLLTLIGAVLAWCAPLVVVWFGLRYSIRRAEGLPSTLGTGPTRDFAEFFGRATLMGIGAFAAIIFIGDFHSVHERYVTPMLMALPFWLTLRWPLDHTPRGAVPFLRVSATVALLMITAWPLWIILGREQLAYPYASFAAALPRTENVPIAILADQEKYAANLAIRLPNAAVWGQIDQPGEIAIVWRDRSLEVPLVLTQQLGDAYEPRGAAIHMSFPYDNLSGQVAKLNARLYIRRSRRDVSAPLQPQFH
jgi:hypothetical protein